MADTTSLTKQSDMPVQSEKIPTKMEKTMMTTPTTLSKSPSKAATAKSGKLVNGTSTPTGLVNGAPHNNGHIDGKNTRQEYEEWLQDSEQDEYEAPDLTLVYEDTEHQGATLSRLNTLRKGVQFCDVILEVGNCEIPGHRAVLACSSVYLFELFSLDDQVVCPAHFRLEGFDYDSFKILVEYAYTAKLQVPEEKVKAVYRTAMMLKMARAAEACSRYLAEHLTPNNCLATRAFANSHSDLDLTKQTDTFIQSNMTKGIAESADLKSLPCIQINILGVDEADLGGENKKNLCQLVVSWVSENHGESLDELYKDLRVLYLTSDNTLRDCHDADDELFTGSNIIKDYKKKDKHRKKVPEVLRYLQQSVMGGG